MRRAAAVALVALALSFAAVACGSAKATPGVPKANFTPKAELLVHSCVPPTSQETASGCASSTLYITKPGDELSARVTHVPEGSVLTVKNVDTHDRQIQATMKDQVVFDTGILKPEDSTTIVLDTPGTLTITDPTMDLHTTLVVAPTPGAKP
jgi:hypothetical protein